MTTAVDGTRSLIPPPELAAPAGRAAGREARASAPPEGARRWLNVGVAAVMLIVALPVMVLLAILIKLTSRGPVFYTQTRIGIDRRLPEDVPLRLGRRRTCDLGGQPFVIYKFRTMRFDAERNRKPVWASRDDPRITWIGRILRQARLDELPQLINVLRGDMNVVGPRPERPSIFARLVDEVDAYPLRQRVRPGITGLAQISHHYDRSLDDVRRKLNFDLEYIEHQGVWTDLKIMFKTVPVILFRRGGW